MGFDQNKLLKYSGKYPDLDWSGSEYFGSAGLMTAICKKHGPVTKRGSHWNVNGCPHCGRDRMLTRVESRYDGFRAKSAEYAARFRGKWDEFIKAGKFDFSETVFVNSTVKVVVGCKDHGLFFEAIPKNLVKEGYSGCAKCRVGAPKGSGYYAKLIEDKWGGEYTYGAIPEHRHDKITAACREHGPFEVWLNNHLAGAGCPVCSSKQSKPETEILEFIRSVYSGKVVSRDRSIIWPMELDIYLPDIGLAVEYNGLHWHADDSGATPLRQKWEMCNAAGVRLINVFEDEWGIKRDIVKSRLMSVVKASEKTYARLCSAGEVSSRDANKFHAKHHLNGPSGGVHFSLSRGGRILAVLTMKNHGDKWEVMRYSSAGTVVGGFSKLFKRFMVAHNAQRVISYCDLRYGNGGLYGKNGFSLVKVTKPDYFWFKNHVRYGRYGFQKRKLAVSAEFAGVYSKDKTEREMATEKGYRRISGVGHQLWEYCKST